MIEWLQKTTSILSNQEILEMSQEERDSSPLFINWFNPFTQPEKLEAERLRLDLKPTEWRHYVEDNYPGIDAQEEYRKRKKEVGNRYKLERVKKCGAAIPRVNFQTGDIVEIVSQCKIYDLCPKCASTRRDNIKRELIDNIGMRVVFCSDSGYKELSKNYDITLIKRYPQEDGTNAVVINTQDEIGQFLTYDAATKISQAVQLTGKRTSGKLGKQIEPEPEQEMIIDFDNINPKTLTEYEAGIVEYREMEIEYNEYIKDVQQLNEIVHDRVKLDNHPETLDQLQYAIYVIENTVKQVCQEYRLEFNFYVRKKEYIDIKSVDWQWLKDKLSRA